MNKREIESSNIDDPSQIFTNKIPDFDRFKKTNIVIFSPLLRNEENPIEQISTTKSRNTKSNSENPSASKNSKEKEKNLKIKLAQQENEKKALFEIANDHIYMFEKITNKVVNEKYKKVFEDIYHFILQLDYYEDSFLQTLMINTDQNADLFFDIMEKYFKNKFGNKKEENLKKKKKNNIPEESDFSRNHSFTILKESNFSDLKNLFLDLKLYEDRDISEDSNYEIVIGDRNQKENEENNKMEIDEEETKSQKNKRVNIIIIREIHLINQVQFNIFITKLIEFNQYKHKKFNNIILFDVSYDPKGLFEKLKPNILTKIVFNNLDYISSKNIYKEILYNFVHGKHKISDSDEFSFFIPDAKKTKIIIDYVTTHQISLNSFQYYFKFLILEYFVFKKWTSIHYLIYYTDLSDKLRKQNMKENNCLDFNRDEYIPLAKGFFKEKTDLIYGRNVIEDNSLNNLVKFYTKNKNTREIFLTIYEYFENCVEKLEGFNDKYNKYDFIYDFLQFEVTKDKEMVSKNRADLVMRFIEENKNIFNVIKNILIPEMENLSKNLVEKSKESQTIKLITKEIKKLITLKSEKDMWEINISGSKAISKFYNKGDNSNYKNSETNEKLKKNIDSIEITLYTNEEISKKLKKIFFDLFKDEMFSNFDKAANLKDEEIKDYLNEISTFRTPIDADETNIDTYKSNGVIHKTMQNFENEYYFNFDEITNPSMQNLVLNDLFGLQIVRKKNSKNENIIKSIIESSKKSKSNSTACIPFMYKDFLVKREKTKEYSHRGDDYMNYSKLLKMFLITFAEIGLEFRLKLFFVDYLETLGIELSNKSKVDTIRNIFLKFCHEFYLMGLISRKRINSDVFVKNFFQLTGYFDK